MISLILGGIAISNSLQRSEEVAADVLSSARADTGRGARDDLAEANARLVVRGLPVFETPGPDAPNYQLQRQAARAWAMSDYPEPLAQQVRNEVAAGTRPGTTPILLPGVPGEPSDVVVDIIPIDPIEVAPAPGGTRAPLGPTRVIPAPPRTLPQSPPAPAPGTTRPTTRPAPAPVPTTQPPRGLFPLLPPVGPIRIPPLIGAS